jgi:acetylglutamate kinase
MSTVSAVPPAASRLDSSTAKAAALVEALPWLARFHGRTIVIKYGGHAMADAPLREAFAEDIVFLRYAGLRVVIVHGGGPQITSHLERLGVETEFRGGLRVTTPETMDVVRMVLVGQVNRDVVGLINAHGPFAVGMSGEDAHLLTAERRGALVDGELVDIGQVGDVIQVRPATVNALLDAGHIPVIAGVARGEDEDHRTVYNINADTAAAALAMAVKAEKLVILTDVEGLYANWPETDEVISEVKADELEAMMPGMASGMVPKMEACLRAVQGGVPQAHVLDGRVAHAILREIFTDSGVGTMVTP